MGLFDLLRPRPPADWPTLIEKARSLMDGLHYRKAADLLAPRVTAREGGTGSPPPAALAMLGECLFQSGQAGRAVEPTARAVERSRKEGTADDSLAFLGNLYEIHRYRGDGSQAGACADEMAEVFASQGRAAEADHYRRQARLVRVGEPPVRVVVDLDGVRREVDEVVAGLSGAVRFAVERNRLTLRPAAARVELAEAQSKVGHFADALTLLEEAVAVDPFAPEPHLRAGLASVYLERYGEGAESLAACERLAPGWPLARPALWLARELERGTLTHEAFLAWHLLEEGPLSGEARVAFARRAAGESPRLALAHLLYGKALKAWDGAGAESAFRRALAQTDQPDVRTRALVELAGVVDAEGERSALLREAVALNGDLIAAATARVVLAFA